MPLGFFFAVIMRQRLLRFAACVAVLFVHGDKAVRTSIDFKVNLIIMITIEK